jgi:hypothetical protein
MTEADAKTIVEAHADTYAQALGISHYWIRIEYVGLDGDGECDLKPEYEGAIIRIDPAKHDTEVHLLGTLRHEMLHIVLADYELLVKATQAMARSGYERLMLYTASKWSCERTLRQLERVLRNITPEQLAALKRADA